MLYLLRHLLAVLTLPVTVAVVVPVWIARRYAVDAVLPDGVKAWTAVVAGALLLTAGVALFVASLRHFASEGRGTLAPWDPPRTLVVRGPYRYVRNPMISGVWFMLAGTALCLRSVPHAAWAAMFAATNLTFIPLLEEPQLEQRFGESYRTYREHVPRFVPLVRPWSQK